MDYKEQVENLLYDAKDWGGDPHIRKDLYGSAQSITDLLARAKAAENERDALKARFCAEDPCKNCNHYASHFPGCDDDCLKCQKECPCNQCCEYSMWEWNGQKEE